MSGLEAEALGAATARLCERSECRGDYSLDECEYFSLFDTLVEALLATDPDGCVSDFTTYYECLADATSCDEAPECDQYYPSESSPCAEASDLSIGSPFVGSKSFCEREVACYADGLDGPDEIAFEEQECLAMFEADMLTSAHLGGPSCGKAHRALGACVAAARLACNPSGEEEEEACPNEIAALEAACDR